MPDARYARFEDIKFDLLKGVLADAEGQETQVEPKVQSLLTLMVESNGEVLERKQILTTLWDDPENADDRLRAVVKKTREALLDNARSPRYIKTIPKRGYLFLPPVIFESEDVQPERASPMRWFSSFLICCLICIAIIYFSVFYSPKIAEPLSTWTTHEEKTHAIEHGWRTYPLSNNALFTITNNDNLVAATWFSDNQQDIRIELNNKALLYEGLSVNQKAAYILTKQNDVVEFTYWDLSINANLNTIILANVPEQIIAFDSVTGDIYYSIDQKIENTDAALLSEEGNSNAEKQESTKQVIKANVNAPTRTEVLLDNIESGIDSIHITDKLDKLFMYSNELVSSVLTVFDISSNVREPKELNFPIAKIVDSDVFESVMLASKDNRVFGFNVQTQDLTLWQTRLKVGDQLIGVCGANCLLVHRAADTFKIYEHSLVPKNNNALTAARELGSADAISSITAENDKLFVSGYQANGMRITRVVEEQHRIVAELESLSSIQHLVSNPSSSLIAGTSADRIFIIEPATGEFRWLDIPISKAGFPQFDLNDDNQLYFTSLDPRFDHAVFQYDLTENTYERMATNVLMQLPLSDALSLTLSREGYVRVVEGSEIVLERKITDPNILRIYPNYVAFVEQERLDIFDVNSGQINEYQRPTLFDTEVFDFNPADETFTFASIGSKQSSIIKMTQAEKSY